MKKEVYFSLLQALIGLGILLFGLCFLPVAEIISIIVGAVGLLVIITAYLRCRAAFETVENNKETTDDFPHNEN